MWWDKNEWRLWKAGRWLKCPKWVFAKERFQSQQYDAADKITFWPEPKGQLFGISGWKEHSEGTYSLLLGLKEQQWNSRKILAEAKEKACEVPIFSNFTGESRAASKKLRVCTVAKRFKQRIEVDIEAWELGWLAGAYRLGSQANKRQSSCAFLFPYLSLHCQYPWHEARRGRFKLAESLRHDCLLVHACNIGMYAAFAHFLQETRLGRADYPDSTIRLLYNDYTDQHGSNCGWVHIRHQAVLGHNLLNQLPRYDTVRIWNMGDRIFLPLSALPRRYDWAAHAQVEGRWWYRGCLKHFYGILCIFDLRDLHIC